MTHYSDPPHPEVDALVGRHMELIVAEVRRAGGDAVGCVALTGGFGRGEGGVEWVAGRPRPVNDYDVLVVARGDGLAGRLRLRRRLKAVEPALSRACGIRVDIACKTPAMLAALGPTVEAYEFAGGHTLLWGDGAPLSAIAAAPAALPACEATRYLFNRGAALLWARRMLDAGSPDEERRRFVLVAALKAWLAWGDALLLLAGRYTLRYGAREAALAGIGVPAGLEFVAPAYAAGLAFKLRPDFTRFAGADLPALLERTIRRHELVWRHVETVRDTAAGEGPAFWQAFADAPAPLLRPAGRLPLSRRLNNLALNLLRARARSLAGLGEHPEERLVRALPALLFGAAAPAAEADRFIAIWHPGQPVIPRSAEESQCPPARHGEDIEIPRRTSE